MQRIPIIGALGAAWAAWITVSSREKRKRIAAYEEAPHVFAQNLGDLIERAARDGRDPIVYARSIVAMRDSLAEPLKGVGAALNSEIDRLAREVREGASRDAVAETIKVLNNTWPAKRDEIEVRMKQLQAALEAIRRSPAEGK